MESLSRYLGIAKMNAICHRDLDAIITPLKFSKSQKIKYYRQVLLGKEQKIHMSGQVL